VRARPPRSILVAPALDVLVGAVVPCTVRMTRKVGSNCHGAFRRLFAR
jgi:hypothetical protein